jgi:hypothetical protein
MPGSQPAIVAGKLDQEILRVHQKHSRAGTDRVEERCGRSLLLLGTMVRMPAQDGRGPQRLGSGSRQVRRGLGLDLPKGAESAGFPISLAPPQGRLSPTRRGTRVVGCASPIRQ